MSLNYGYTGEPTDDNNLVYLRARYYNRNTGTFLSLDPYEGDPTRPMSLNRYAYAEGNPINHAVGEPISQRKYHQDFVKSTPKSVKFKLD